MGESEFILGYPSGGPNGENRTSPSSWICGFTDYSLSTEVWMAWQYDRPDLGEGMVQAFRRPDNTEEYQTYKLRGLNPDTNYIVTNLDVNQPQKRTGRDLMETGLKITTKEKPAALIITYKKIK